MNLPVSDSHTLLSLPLDISLQLWVVLPITIATLLVALLRRNLSPVVLCPAPPTLHSTIDASRLARASNLLRNARFLPPAQFNVRRDYLVRPNGPLDKPVDQLSPMGVVMNPDSLAIQAASVALTVLPQMFLGEWASRSFAGLVVCRLPFSLTPRFRSMLQSGVEAAGHNLDVSYVSSLSWYVLNLFGISGLLTLFAQPHSKDEPAVVLPNITSNISQTFSPNKVFSTEREALVNLDHSFTVAQKHHEKFLSSNVKIFSF